MEGHSPNVMPTAVEFTEAPQALDLAGSYFLRNLPGGDSELTLEPDGCFDFMVTYGAADYRATGVWAFEDGGVVLNSVTDPAAAPFRLLRSVASRIPGVRIWVTTPHGGAVSYIDVQIEAATGPGADQTDSDGVAFFANAKAAVSAAFRIPVYHFESGPVELNPAHNEFFFEINGDQIMRVPFRNERLEIEGDSLVLRYWGTDHPLRYEK
jgi:hypothetical protein